MRPLSDAGGGLEEAAEWGPGGRNSEEVSHLQAGFSMFELMRVLHRSLGGLQALFCDPKTLIQTVKSAEMFCCFFKYT